MGEAEATMEARLAAITVSLNESHRLLASCARRLGVKKQDTTSLFAATTTLLSATDQVPKQPGIKHSPPLLISMHQVVGAHVPHVDAIFVRHAHKVFDIKLGHQRQQQPFCSRGSVLG